MAYKILSLDGGGSWALIQARVLKDIYGDVFGHEILRQFDMAIANSGGSLVLASLCCDLKPSEIIDIFKTKEKRNKVFSPIGWRYASLIEPIIKLFTKGPRYYTKEKLEALTQILSAPDPRPKPIVTKYLDEIPLIIGKNYNNKLVDLIICGFDYYRMRASFFRSNINSRTDIFDKGQFYHISLAEAIHASSNAPVRYFEKPAEVELLLTKENEEPDTRRTWFWDGAISGFNNPVLAALVEAITNLAAPDNDYRILSIGNSITKKAVLADYQYSSKEEIRRIWERNKNKKYVTADSSFSYKSDIEKLSKSILSDPPDAATFIAYSFLHPNLDNTNPKIVRINPCLSPIKKGDEYVVPDIYKNHEDEFIRLIEMDMDATKDEDVLLIDDLCNRFIVNSGKPEDSLPNQLIRGNNDSGNFYLGFPTYYSAKQRWSQLK